MQTNGGKTAACSTEQDADSGFCDVATNLSWSESSPTTSLLVTAKWTPSTSPNLMEQQLQIYADANCSSAIGSPISSLSPQSTTSTYKSDFYQTLTFKVLSTDSKGRKNKSSCSSAIVIQSNNTTTATPSVDSTPPTISAIGNMSTLPSTVSNSINFKIGDDKTTLACSSLYLSMLSSNSSVVDPTDVQWSGTYPNCSATIQPVNAATGSSSLTFKVRDDADNTSQSSFQFTVSSTIALGQTGASYLANVRYGINTPVAVLTIGTKFLTLDYSSGRINIYNSIPSSPNTEPDLVIGSSSLTFLDDSAPVSGSNLRFPMSMTTDGTKLIVSDTFNHRVLIWNTLPTSSGAAADVVIGQANFTDSSSNAGAAASANTLNNPEGVFVYNSKLYVADRFNHRVLVWNSIPTVSFANADMVIGQSNMTGTTGSTTSTALNGPTDISAEGNTLAISDWGNNRVLLWTTLPTSNGSAANVVLGQPNFTASTPNNGGVIATSLSGPSRVMFNNNKLFVGDANNNRFLIWNSIPNSNNQAASIAIGQANLTSNVIASLVAVSASNIGLDSFISSASVHDGKLFIPDPLRSRILIWNSVPTIDGQNADSVLGQPNLTTGLSYNHGKSAVSLGVSANPFSDGTRLVIADPERNRVLIWNTIPTSHSTLPDVVLGQPNLYSSIPNYGGVSASSLYYPSHAIIVGTKLLVTDTQNHRVLIWNTLPTSNNQAADLRAGQANFTQNSVNAGGGRSACSMSFPFSSYYDGTKLYVADRANHRVLVYNTFPTANGACASFVLGQTNTTNGGMSPTAVGMSSPSSVVVIGTRLFVSQNVNRVSVWNTIPSATGTAADFALGQTSLTSIVDNAGGLSASGLWGPLGIATDGTRLFLSDSQNHRILVWNSAPTSYAQAADAVIGQSSFTVNSTNGGILSESSLNYPNILSFAGGKLFIGDSSNQRVLIKPYP